jgi:molybdopterin synthase sulfur carrier subunit
MDVTVKLFAALRRYRPGLALGQAFPCSLPEQATVADLISEALGVPPQEVAIILVNGQQRDRGCTLRSGDTVGLWPPIAGG